MKDNPFQLYEYIVGTMDVPVLVCDAAREIIFANRAFYRLFPGSPPLPGSTSIYQVVYPGSRDKMKSLFAQAQAKQETSYQEINFYMDRDIITRQVKVVSREGCYLVMGFPADPNLEKLQQELIKANNEAANLNRELNKKTFLLENKNREIESLYNRLESEVYLVQTIYRRLLPEKVPVMEDISLAAHYQPAQRIGGDSYDVIHRGRNLIIYLSDVTGHGMEGAIFSTFVKEAINSYVSLKPGIVCPPQILRHLDRQYRQENYPEDYFISIFLAVLDLETKKLCYTGAGFQNKPLVCLGSGKKGTLVSKGMPISSCLPRELVDFQVEYLSLDPGATLLFYTDGLPEQVVGKGHYGERLKKVFYDNTCLPPGNIVQAIHQDFTRINRGNPQGDDDITLLALQYQG